MRLTKRQVRVAAVIGALYGLFWLATCTFGVPQILADIPHGKVRSLSYDPIREDRPAPEPPWEYVSAFSPAPFIVVIDWGIMQAWMLGSGGREYFFWFFGLQVHLRGVWIWNS